MTEYIKECPANKSSADISRINTVKTVWKATQYYFAVYLHCKLVILWTNYYLIYLPEERLVIVPISSSVRSLIGVALY